jgi:hypothetical protein
VSSEATGLTLAQRIEAATLLPEHAPGTTLVSSGFVGALAHDLLATPFEELAAVRVELAHLITPAAPAEEPS